jgi:hypothetical protein
VGDGQPWSRTQCLRTGWGGVLRWCLDFATREDDPTLPGFDLFVAHIDVWLGRDGEGVSGFEGFFPGAGFFHGTQSKAVLDAYAKIALWVQRSTQYRSREGEVRHRGR